MIFTVVSQAVFQVPGYESRFQMMAPCPSVPAVMIDRYGSGIGLGSETARAKGWQGRVLWIDATANIDRYNTVDKIKGLTATIADSGFNTIVFDVKPISGQTVYPSHYAPKLLTWRGQNLPESFDPVGPMISEAHRHRLNIILSMNAFSEGHRLFKTGPGYKEPNRQTVLYIPKPLVRIGSSEFPLVIGEGKGGDSIRVVSTLPKEAEGVWAQLGPQGSVVATGVSGQAPVEGGGKILYGEGAAGKFLATHARAGVGVEFDTKADYVPIGSQVGGQIPLMMNPNDPTVQAHALDMIREVLTQYAPDGLIYDDRLRYAGQDGDFSETTRSQFEGVVGKRLNWPDDVFKYTLTSSLSKGLKIGPYYDLWQAWRAHQIRRFVSQVRETVKSARPSAQFGAYVGSWYGDYPALGHNYASPEAKPGFWFDLPGYSKEGTAPLLDYLMVGCYYPTATIYEAIEKGVGPGYTVEAGGALGNRLARDETWVYAGIDCGGQDAASLGRLVQAACASTQGVMVFDLSHGMDKLWGTFKKIFSQRVEAPHAVAGSVAALRAHRKLVDNFHQPERPIIIMNGSAGIGQ